MTDELISDSDYSEKLENIVGVLKDIGIHFEDLGLYGSLQVGMRKKRKTDIQRQDVDIVIKGLDYLYNIKNISDEILNSYDIKRFDKSLSYFIDDMKSVTESKFNAIARQRRDEYLAFLLDDIPIHMKLSRKSKDPISFPFDYNQDDYSSVSDLEGIIIDDIEASTIPATFKVKLDDKQTVNVSTLIFFFSGAAWKGDKVKINGKLINQDNIVLDHLDHYIYKFNRNKL